MLERRERSLLFRADMARAAMRGDKTETRRLCPVQPKYLQRQFGSRWAIVYGNDSYEEYESEAELLEEYVPAMLERSPYREGDLLWQREAYRLEALFDRLPPSRVPGPTLAGIRYEADKAFRPIGRVGASGLDPAWGRHRSGRFMMRVLSRQDYDFLGVDVERVQAITEEQAKAEGVVDRHDLCWPDGDPGNIDDAQRRGFARLWESIHGEGAWARNQMVFRFRFRRVE